MLDLSHPCVSLTYIHLNKQHVIVNLCCRKMSGWSWLPPTRLANYCSFTDVDKEFHCYNVVEKCPWKSG